MWKRSRENKNEVGTIRCSSTEKNKQAQALGFKRKENLLYTTPLFSN